jgi:hypothetical protein
VKSKRREALKAGSPKRAAPNINCVDESCGKLKAARVRTIFLAAEHVFFWRLMRGGEQFRENAAAMISRKIFRQFAIAR